MLARLERGVEPDAQRSDSERRCEDQGHRHHHLVAGGGCRTRDHPGDYSGESVPDAVDAGLEEGRWHLLHEADVRPGAGEAGELIRPTDVALADNGMLAVVDRDPLVINLYGPDGRFRRSIGREGSGPGEYQAALVALRGDTLVVQDPRLGRASSFDIRTGELIAERSTSCCIFSQVWIDDSGRTVVQWVAPPDSTAPSQAGFVRFALAGTDAESLVVFGAGKVSDDAYWDLRVGGAAMRLMAPNQPLTFFEYRRTGLFLTGWSGAYSLRLTRDGRDTVLLFGRPWAPAPVTAAQKEALVEQSVARVQAGLRGAPDASVIREALDPRRIPDHHPAFQRIASDGAGRVWVRTGTREGAVVDLDVFDANGRWLDRFYVEEPSWAVQPYAEFAFSTSHLVLILEAADGLPVIRKYRIVRDNV